MAVTSFSQDFIDVASAHLIDYLKTDPTDQYFNKHPTLTHMLGKKATRSGGLNWAWPVEDGRDSPNGGSYIKFQGTTLVDQNAATMAKTSPAFYKFPITVAYTDVRQAGGEGAIFDLVEAKTRLVKRQAMKKIATDLFASTKTLTTDIDSIPLAIPADPTASVAFNLLNGAAGSQTYWRNRTYTSVGSFNPTALDKVDVIINDILTGSAAPTMIVTTQAIFQYWQKAIRGYYQLTSNGVSTRAGKQMADLGFPVIYHQSIPVTWDPYCPSGLIYFLNDDAIQLEMLEGSEFTMLGDGFERTDITGVIGMQAYVKFEGNLCVYERRALGQLSGVTA